jgi:hypothetical protein
MPRRPRYDDDEERLPHGMTRVGYDADTEVYTFQDEDGSYWEGAPGCEYGQLTRVGQGQRVDTGDAEDSQPFLPSETMQPKVSWRHELMPLLNFGVLVGVTLLLLLWYLHRSAASDENAKIECPLGFGLYTVQQGDTCWDLGESRDISVGDIQDKNPGLDCDKLRYGVNICLPN